MALKLLFSLTVLVNFMAWYWWSQSSLDQTAENNSVKKRIANAQPLQLLSERVNLERLNINQRLPSLETLAVNNAQRDIPWTDAGGLEPSAIEMKPSATEKQSSAIENSPLPEQLILLDITKRNPMLLQQENGYGQMEDLSLAIVEQNEPSKTSTSDDLAANNQSSQQTNLVENTQTVALAIDSAELSAVVDQEGTATSLIGVNSCLRVGPFSNAETIAAAESSLSEISVTSRRVEAENTIEHYWVLLPPRGEEQQQKLEQYLAGKPIEPFSLGGDEYSGYLSAGFFESAKNAENYAIELVAVVGEVLVKPQTSIENESWLEITVETPQQMDQLAQIQLPQSNISTSNCAELADRQ